LIVTIRDNFLPGEMKDSMNKVAVFPATPGNKYAVDAYRWAIVRACELAFPVPDDLPVAQHETWRKDHRWRPTQLWHEHLRCDRLRERRVRVRRSKAPPFSSFILLPSSFYSSVYSSSCGWPTARR
jgi:hypothetical protein